MGNTTLQHNYYSFELLYPSHLNDFYECILRIGQQQCTSHLNAKVTLTHLATKIHRFVSASSRLGSKHMPIPLFSAPLDNYFHKLEQDEARHCQIFLLPDVL